MFSNWKSKEKKSNDFEKKKINKRNLKLCNFKLLTQYIHRQKTNKNCAAKPKQPSSSSTTSLSERARTLAQPYRQLRAHVSGPTPFSILDHVSE
jgi:hypothetical protein